MNETLQQFCQRILPAVQAGAEGKEIEFKYSMVSHSKWEKKDGLGFGKEFEYRIAQPKATPLPITPEMWAMINPKYKWAYFQHGCIIFSASKPGWDDETRWFTSKGTGDFCESPLAIDTTGIVPELSLTERQNDDDSSSEHEDVSYECKIVNCGVFDVSDPVCAALDEMIKSFIQAASEASSDEEQRPPSDMAGKELEKELRSGNGSATHHIGDMPYKKIGDFWYLWEEGVGWKRSTLPIDVIVNHAKKLS